jgi:uncharacterized protein (DUF433 family)
MADGARRGDGRRALTADDLLRLKLWYQIGNILSQDRRHELFEAIEAKPDAKTVKASELLLVDVGEARRQIAARTRDLEAAEAMVVRDKAVMADEPVCKGTRILVRAIAAMLADGADADDILDGYPKLAKRQLELAPIWVAAHPQRGRPRTLKAQGLAPKSVTGSRSPADHLRSTGGAGNAAPPACPSLTNTFSFLLRLGPPAGSTAVWASAQTAVVRLKTLLGQCLVTALAVTARRPTPPLLAMPEHCCGIEQVGVFHPRKT